MIEDKKVRDLLAQ